MKGKILLVDDERDLIDIYPLELRRQGGLEVQGFTDPAVALEEFRSASDDYVLVISDIRMPKINGFEFVRQIKEIKPEVKILFITAFEINNNEFSTVLPSTKADGFIQKPITPSKLVDLIKATLTKTESKEAIA